MINNKVLHNITLLVLSLMLFTKAYSQFTQQNEFPHLNEANDYLKVFNDPIKALEVIEQELIAYPNSVEILLKSARLKQIYGFEEEAQIDIEKAISINPLALDFYGFYGPENIINVLAYMPENSIVELGLERRLEPYKKLLKEASKTKQLSSNQISLLKKSIKIMQQQSPVKAMDGVNKAIKKFPNCAIAHDLKGLILETQNKPLEAANSLSKAVVLEPGYALAWYNFSRVERKLGKYDLAEKYLDRAIALNSNLSKAYFDKALLLKATGETKAAVEIYNEVLENADDFTEAYLNRGLTLKMLGDLDGALKDIKKAIEQFPANAQLHKNLGNIRFMKGNHIDAIKDYDKAIELDAFMSEAFMNRGLAKFLIGETIEACQDFNRSSTLGFERADKKIDIFCNK